MLQHGTTLPCEVLTVCIAYISTTETLSTLEKIFVLQIFIRCWIICCMGVNTPSIGWVRTVEQGRALAIEP